MVAYINVRYLNGLVVQLVRMPPCHGGGRGFESHPGRQRGNSSVVEHLLAKEGVASSNLVFRSQEKAMQVVFSFFMHFSCRKFFVYLLRVL